MIIDTKFNVGGVAWTIEHSKVLGKIVCVEKTIKQMSVTVHNDSTMTVYLWITNSLGVYEWIKTDDVFLTKEDLLKSL